MLSQRQIEILLEFCSHTEEYLTGTYLADKFGVSLRTVQGDIKVIREELSEESCARIVSRSSKGSMIEVSDYEEFSTFVTSLYQEYMTVSLNYSVNRVSKMMLLLLNRHRAVSLMDLEEEFYISRSTVQNDLKKVEELLGKFDLELMRGNNKVMIDGFEMNKRRCLSEQDLYLAYTQDEQKEVLFFDERQIAKIQNVLTEVFVNHQYHIMDMDFNNTILFLNIMICRMNDGFYIQPNEIDAREDLGAEYEVARDVVGELSKKFFVKANEDEIRYFSLYLKGQGDNRDSDMISPQMHEFVENALEAIKDNFNVDFTDRTNLRITLALHCMSLLVRAKYDMQIKNDMLEYIRESFPLGYDIATYFAHLFSIGLGGKRVSKDEIALLTVHFYSALLEMNHRENKKKILVISSLKNSMTVLLRQTLLRWFSEYVATVSFIDSRVMVPEMMDNYDVFLTTEKGDFFEKGIAMYVNAFPTQNDYINIKLNLDGFRNIEDITNVFRPELFDVMKSGRKQDILKEMCENASQLYGLEGLYNQVLQRENIGSSYFSKDIAVPHPMNAVSSDTFIVVRFSEKPIIWDEEKNRVNLVMLMHIGRNNPQAFQMWNYLSKLFASKELIEQMSEDMAYEHFITLIKAALEKGLNEKSD